MPPVSLLLLPLLAASPSWPQESEEFGTWFGHTVCALDDLDGDGFPEYAVSAPFAREVRGDRSTGMVLLFSGKDHRLIRKQPGWWWSLTAVRDRDGDGARDLLLGGLWYRGARNPPPSQVVSSRTGEVLLEFAKGEEVLGETAHGFLIADPGLGEWLKLEGPSPQRERRDVVGASPETSWFLVPGRDEIVSVDGTGMLIAFSLPSGPARELGRPGRPGWSDAPQLDIDSADMDGDGVPDLLIGNPRVQHDAGGVLVVSGRSSEILHDVSWVEADHRGTYPSAFGHSVAFVGDLDGDGNEEFAVGSPGDGNVVVHSGCDALWQWGFSIDFLDQPGVSMTLLHDYDGDGFTDLLVGGGQHVWSGTPWLNGTVSVVSARTGENLFTRHESELPVLFGEPEERR